MSATYTFDANTTDAEFDARLDDATLGYRIVSWTRTAVLWIGTTALAVFTPWYVGLLFMLLAIGIHLLTSVVLGVTALTNPDKFIRLGAGVRGAQDKVLGFFKRSTK